MLPPGMTITITKFEASLTYLVHRKMFHFPVSKSELVNTYKGYSPDLKHQNCEEIT